MNDILDISRIEAGRITLKRSALEMREIAEEVLVGMRRRSQEENRAITFTLEVPEDLPPVNGDYDRVRQVLTNLVTNGYTYTPAGGRVEVHMSTTNSVVRVDVKDTGIGLSEKDRARLFERFYRGEDPLVLASSGTGLGLALSKTLVEMHLGQIWCESSDIGAGSMFSFTLPVYQSEVKNG